MSREARCLKVPKHQGQKTLDLANQLKIIDKQLEIQRDNDFLYIPLINQPSPENLRILMKEEVSFDITTRSFKERRRPKASLAELLERQLPPHLLASLPHGMDLVGDIAIVEIPPELETHKNTIGKAILKSNKNVHTVLAKAGAVSGTYRLREFHLIAGEHKTETIHKENGCQYQVDVAKVYFSPRLSHEHKRVASLTQEDETIVDLFAGVGPFAILIAKMHENVKIYTIDANPRAVEYLKTNIRLNRVIGKIHPFLGDAKRVVEKNISGVADRVIMNLPENAMDFVPTACCALKPEGGVIHFYCFVNAASSLEDIKSGLTEAAQKSGRKVDRILPSRMVRETAPFEWQAVFDVSVR